MIRRARNLQEGMGMTYRRRTVSFKEHLSIVKHVNLIDANRKRQRK